MDILDNFCMGCMNKIGAERLCPYCGYAVNTPFLPNTLKPGTVLSDRYLLGRVLDSNGESISYIGYSIKKDIKVTVSEFFPENMAIRDKETPNVKIIPGYDMEFSDCMAAFIKLATNLQKMRELPNIANVIDIFKENNTVYYVSEYLDGTTLREYLKRIGGKIKWDHAKALFLPLLSTIASLHNADIYHRGISPQTIIVAPNGKLNLTDFCTKAARTSQSSLTPQLFSGYAAAEQYDIAYMQGSWTDVYGISATIYRCLTGVVPQDSKLRLKNDELQEPALIDNAIPIDVSNAIMKGMELLSDNRTKTIDQLRIELIKAGEEYVDDSYEEEESPPPTKKSYALKATLLSFGVLVVVFGLIFFIAFGDKIFADKSKPETSSLPVYTTTTSEPPSTSIDPNSKILYGTPNLIGKTLEEINAIPDKYYTVKIKGEMFDDKVPKGQIMEQDPKPDTPIEENQPVNVIISKGPSKLKLPVVIGRNIDEVKAELDELGFKYVEIPQFNDTVEPGTVTQVIPEENKLIDVGSVITLYVSINGSEEDETSSAEGE